MSRRSPWLVAVAVVAVAAGVLSVDRVAPPAEPRVPTGEPVALDATPTGGLWTCAVGDGRDDTDLEVFAARPGAVGDGPAVLDVATLQGGERRGTPEPPPVFPGSAVALDADPDADGAVDVRWSSGPVAVDRAWSIDADDLPPALVAGPCPQPFGTSWFVPGMSTEGGESAWLRLANPFPTDATVAIDFLTPGEPEAPLALSNLTVSARSTLEIEVAELLPERPDLAARVELSTGRVAVEGLQLADQEIGGIDGGSLLAATPGLAESWTVPWIADGEDTAAWLWVANPGERTATAELTLHTPDGGQVPTGLSEVAIPAGELRRVDLRGTLPEGEEAAGLTVRAEGTPLAVSAAVQLAGEAPAETAMAVQLAQVAADPAWTVSGGSTSNRAEWLHVVNPGAEPAVVDVALFAGTSASRPSELQDVEVAPGGSVALDLKEELGVVDRFSAFLTASEGEVVVARRSWSGDDELRYVLTPATPSAAWASGVVPVDGVRRTGLVQQLGTSAVGAESASAPGAAPDDPATEVDGPGADPDGPGTEVDDLGADPDGPGTEVDDPGTEPDDAGDLGPG